MLGWLLIDVHKVLLVRIASVHLFVLATSEQLLRKFEPVLLLQVFLLHQTLVQITLKPVAPPALDIIFGEHRIFLSMR